MPAEIKPSAPAEPETPTKSKASKPSAPSSSKAATARVTLLDGSILDVTIDVSNPIHSSHINGIPSCHVLMD